MTITSLAQITLFDSISKAEKATQGQALSVTPATVHVEGVFRVTVIKDGKSETPIVGLDGELSK